ncbi:MAG: hypothetical protein B6242_05535 [Anaerolineaceae bacterium 4572_78]|nr:MAG: hypothetical protein B6242_05535 [Anaerolineaceae bacterium 4572_78]
MEINTEYVNEQIHLGIKAHKAGDDLTARLYFQSALREDDENLVSLLWLAYLAPDHEKRVILLKRVLEIDPDNKRAQAGLKWAKEELEKEKNQVGKSSENLPSFGNLQTKFQATDLRKKARKGTIAQRARRRIGRV